MNRVKVYDAEVFQNYISFIFIDFEDYLAVRKRMDDENIPPDKREEMFNSVPYIIFEISCVEGYEKNDIGGLLSYTSQNDYLSGFNSLGYDNLILNFIAINSSRYRNIKKLIEAVYSFSTHLIETPSEILYKEERINLLKRYNGNYKSIDVQKIAALDKIFKSLKQTLINLKWHNILDYKMPADPSIPSHVSDWERPVKREYVPGLIHYNINDVLGTCELFYFLLKDIILRFEISEEYNINVLSASDSKIGDVFFRKFYTEATGMSVSEFVKGRTYRKALALNRCVHESVQFRTMPFKKMLSDIKSRIVYSTKELKVDFVHNGVTYNIRSGGLHSVDYPGIFKSTDTISIRDADVSSYYPNLVINGRVKPSHLSDMFFKVYQTIVDDRMEAKREGYKTKAAVLKITANGVYGKFNFEFGPLFDTLCTLQVTITGQLQLLMLVERLTMNGFKVISVNTDGVVAEVPRDKETEYCEICDEWQKDVKLELEYTDYPLYVRRDVNNYFTVKDMSDPFKNLKAKGQLDEFLRIAPPKLQKGFNMPIVARAVQEYFIGNKPVMDTLKECKDIYDFCTTTNIGSKFHLELHKIVDKELVVEQIQKNTRFYISTNGGTLMKIETHGSKKAQMSSGNKVIIFNQYVHNNNMANYFIDYNYYHRQANKMINHIKTGVRPGAKSKKRIKERLDQPRLF